MRDIPVIRDVLTNLWKKETSSPFYKTILCKSLLINKLLKTQKQFFSFWMHWVLFAGAFHSHEEKRLLSSWGAGVSHAVASLVAEHWLRICGPWA